jgi:nitrogen regulatory protein PII
MTGRRPAPETPGTPVAPTEEPDQMKMIVAYIEREAFEPIREELLELGFLSISAWEASGSVPEALVTGRYRGATMETHLRPKTRLECVVGDEHVSTVVDTVLKLTSEHRFLFVVPVEGVFPTDTVKTDDEVAAVTG